MDKLPSNHVGCWTPKGWNDLSKEERKTLRKTKQAGYDDNAKGPIIASLSRTTTTGLVPSCAEGGVLGVLPGVIGCIQANEVIKIILGIGQTLSGRMLSYDALRMSFRD